MPYAIPESKRHRISTKIGLGTPLKDIAEAENVTVRLVQQIKLNIQRYGTPKRPKGPLQGRPTKITKEMQEVQNFIPLLVSRKSLTIGPP